MVLGLFVGAIVEMTGAFRLFNYDIKSYDEDNLDRFIENKGRGEYEKLEEYILEDEEGNDEKKYWVFGYTNGEKKLLNKSEMIEELDTFGDIIIVCVDKNNEPMNVDMEDMENFLVQDIEEDFDNDSHLGSDNEYDYEDGWIINDFEES